MSEPLALTVYVVPLNEYDPGMLGPPTSALWPKMSTTLGAVTVTVAVPCTDPIAARTVSTGVPLDGAVYRPLCEMVPGVPVLLSDHVNAPGLPITAPNWSSAVAVNCR